VGTNFSMGDDLGIQEFDQILARDVEDVGGFLGGEFFMDGDDGNAVALLNAINASKVRTHENPLLGAKSVGTGVSPAWVWVTDGENDRPNSASRAPFQERGAG
jgi:hypothetical protein